MSDTWVTLTVSDRIAVWVESDDFESRAADQPVTLLLHGYGSHEQDLPPILRWLEASEPWASLRAPLALPNGGFAWAPITVPGNPHAAEIETATETLWEWLDYNVPVAPIRAIGFSQGGLMVSQLLRTRPERVDKAAILSGFVLGSPQPADERLSESKPRVFWSHGTADTVIVPESIERTRTFLATHSTPMESEYQGLGHSIDERVLTDLRDYLAMR